MSPGDMAYRRCPIITWFDCYASHQKEHTVSYQLLALDLDGTVISNDLVVQPAVTRAIAATRAFAEQLGIRDPLICYQGGMIRDPLSGEIYAHTTMPGDLAAEAVELLLAAEVFVIAYVEERLCVAERGPALDTYLRWHPEGAEVVVASEMGELITTRQRLLSQGLNHVTSDLAALVGATPPTKLLFVATPPVVEHEMLRLAARFDSRLAVMRSH